MRVKKQQISSPFKVPCAVNLSQIITFSILHTDAHDRLDDISIHHKPHFLQITSVFKPSHNVVRSTEERFAIERMATRGFGAKKIATTLGLPQSTTKRCCRGCARTATWHRATSGDRVVRRLVCVSCPFACFDSHLSACHVCLSSVGPWITRRRTLPGWLVSTPRHCCTAQTSFNHRVPQICLPWTSFCLFQHPALANPTELRALMTRVYRRTWAGSSEMFENIGNAWVRRLKACVAAKNGFF